MNWQERLHDCIASECLPVITETLSDLCSIHVPLKCRKNKKVHRERKILMRKRTKLKKKTPLTLSVQSKLVSIERDLILSYQKEKMFEESLAVTMYFFRYAKKFSVCASETGTLYDKKRSLLTSDKLEMCTILLEQFNSVLQPLFQANR